MRKNFIYTVIFAIIFTGISHAETYKIMIPAWTGFAPANVAQQKGFWKEEGIDVKVWSTTNPQEGLDLLQKRVVHIVFDMIGTGIGLYMDGLPITIIAETDWSHGGDKIIAKKNLDIAGLKDKPIGVYYNKPSITYFLHQYLSTIGMKLSDTRIVEMELASLADNFIGGIFDIIVCYDPDAIRAEREGNGKVVATTATYEGCVPEGMIMMTDVLKKIPESDLIKILKGWIKAVNWVQDTANWKEYVTILNTQTFKDTPMSENDLREMINAVRIHDKESMYNRNKDGGGLQEYLKDINMFLTQNKMIKKEFRPNVIFNNTAVLKALEN